MTNAEEYKRVATKYAERGINLINLYYAVGAVNPADNELCIFPSLVAAENILARTEKGRESDIFTKNPTVATPPA